MSATVTGVFASAEQADRAVHELRRAGFAAEEIGVLQLATDAGCRSEGGVTVGTGAGVGLLAGASLGGLAGAAPGMVAGAAVGGVLGALIDLGIPEDAACFYKGEAEAGRAVVLVRAAGRSAEAIDILWLNGGQEVRTSPAAPAIK
jgi:hypothetical protein